MGLIRFEEFSVAHNELADIHRLLSHPARLAILELLLHNPDGLAVGEIVAALPLSQPSVSLHIKELRRGGLVQTAVHGRSAVCSLDRSRFNYLSKKLRLFFRPD